MDLRPALLSLLPALALLGGCGAGYEVVRATPATPIAPPHAFVVLPTTYDGVSMFGKTMDGFAAGLDPEKRSRFASDQAALDYSFVQTLNAKSAGHWTYQSGAAVPAGGLGVRVHVEKVDRGGLGKGYFTGTVDVVGPDNQTIDEIRIDTDVRPSWTNAQIMGGAGTILGERFTKYLGARSGG